MQKILQRMNQADQEEDEEDDDSDDDEDVADIEERLAGVDLEDTEQVWLFTASPALAPAPVWKHTPVFTRACLFKRPNLAKLPPFFKFCLYDFGTFEGCVCYAQIKR